MAVKSRKKKTTLEYAKEVIMESSGEYRLESTYVNAKSKVKFKHLVCGHYFWMEPNSFNNGQRCTNPICKKERQIRSANLRSYHRLVKQVNQRKDHYILLTKFSLYGGYDSLIRLYCKRCDRYFSMTAHSFLNGRGCYKCGNLSIKLKKMKDPNQFYNEVHNIIGDDYTFESDYQGQSKLVKIKHSCGYSWWAHPESLLAGQKCLKCFSKRGILRSELLKLISSRNCVPTKSLSRDVYYSKDKIELKHYCGHKIVLRVGRIKNPRSKNGICKFCNRKILSEKKQLSTDEFIHRFKNLPFNNEYKIIGKYKGMFVPLKIYHKVCGHYDSVTPQSLLRGRQCKWCRNHSKSIGERLISCWLDCMGIDYEYPKKFEDLKDDGLLHYDFYIPEKNTLIEVQGVQHYQPVSYFGGAVSFKKQKKHDQMKRDYAKKYNYSLVEIKSVHSNVNATVNNVALGLIRIFGRKSLEEAINKNTSTEEEAKAVAEVISSAIDRIMNNYKGSEGN